MGRFVLFGSEACLARAMSSHGLMPESHCEEPCVVRRMWCGCLQAGQLLACHHRVYHSMLSDFSFPEAAAGG
ncbi:hypothetical protein BO78DRAFT_439121 [Aspergillus sclerotiicarbonarius CBS 121057]|uniref:Uncharacterized protein n=1 Tax=Aspergillus sclerotiicarbonarius (strain CBS 121057 / IBT 28362) TaxID=1448318 RepID=A0A319EI84_ASPSB|nr:hypothetical protein BO78DRAFT_439121 [Aspergillus sclerotiicarbonarius CBS 121057]